jgi:RNA polymerase sigma-70 factor, sigma-E family
MSVPSPTVEVAPAASFEAFVAGQQVPLRRYALALTRSEADADDLLQTTLVKVYLAWDRIEDRARLTAFARTTMSRSYVSAWRRWGRHESPSAEPPDRSATQINPVDERDLIWRGLDRLGRRQRAVVVLRYLEDLELSAIAEILGISVGTVKSQLSRALDNLRSYLGSDQS